MLPPLLFFIFFFNDTATTEIYTLSLHDALPIWLTCTSPCMPGMPRWSGWPSGKPLMPRRVVITGIPVFSASADRKSTRLNSSHSQISYAVFCLKKKKQRAYNEPLLVNVDSAVYV